MCEQCYQYRGYFDYDIQLDVLATGEPVADLYWGYEYNNIDTGAWSIGDTPPAPVNCCSGGAIAGDTFVHGGKMPYAYGVDGLPW